MPVILTTAPDLDEGFPTDVATQAHLGSSGIVLGGVDDQGCTWKWNPASAWGAKPAPRESVGDRAYADGQWDATRFYGPRVMSIPGYVRAPSHAALHAAEQRLRDAVTVEPFNYRVVEPGFDSWALVRQQGEVLWTEDGTPSAPHATFSIGLFAGDPLIYSSRLRTFDLQFPSVTGGLGWETGWPASWDADVVAGEQILTNPGKAPSGLRLRVDGPADTVTVSLPDLGRALVLDNPDGPLLVAGQWLSVDTLTRQVLLMGDAGRRSWAYGDWPLLPPGETRLAISGTGTTSTSRVSGSYRAARL